MGKTIKETINARCYTETGECGCEICFDKTSLFIRKIEREKTKTGTVHFWGGGGLGLDGINHFSFAIKKLK